MGKRIDLKVGYSCNNSCWFCAQGDKRSLGDKTLAKIKRDLELSKKNGCDEVVFTGGEPTIRKDFLEMVRYAKSLSYEVIQAQTNGRMFFYKDFCEEAIAAGVNSFGLAIHGDIPEVHDFLVGVPGAFNQVVQGIKNLVSLGQSVVTNTVVVKANYRRAPKIASLLINLGVNQYQMAFVHGCGWAGNNFDSVVPRMSLAAPYIVEALRLGVENNVNVMAEAIPPCLLSGYEDYASENFIPFAEVREKTFFVEDFGKIRKSELKSKFKQCIECVYSRCCEGPWNDYPNHFGDEEFVPVIKASRRRKGNL